MIKIEKNTRLKLERHLCKDGVTRSSEEVIVMIAERRGGII